MDSKQVNFRIARISELSFCFENHLEFNSFKEEKTPDNVSAGLNVSYKWNLEKNAFVVLVTIKFTVAQDRNKPTEFLKHKSATEFYVEDLGKILTVREGGEFSIDRNWETTFVSLAISTARGLMAAKTAGTYYSRFIFPVVDPQKVILSAKGKNSLN